MIEVTKIIQLGGTEPFDYEWESDISGVTFTPKTGTTTDGIVEVVIGFDNETVLTTAVITLNATNGCGREDSDVITVSNVCSGVVVNGPTNNGGFEFTGSASSTGCTSGTFEWIYDNNIFSLTNQVDTSFTSKANFTLLVDNPPSTTPIRLRFTDCNECIETGLLNFAFCKPSALPITVQLTPIDTVYKSGTVQLQTPVGCSDTIPDWSSLVIKTPLSWSYENDGSGGIIVTAPEGTEAGTYIGSYSVYDQYGIRSELGVITYIVEAEVTTTIFVQDRNVLMSCAVGADEEVLIPIEDFITVAEGATIDWSSFQVVTPPTVLGTVDANLQHPIGGKYSISYTTPDPLVDDSFAWQICDADGNCSQAVVYSVNTCSAPPVANDDAYSVDCGSTTEMNVLSNDTTADAPILPLTLTIVSGPSYGTVTLKSNGRYEYVADECFAGVDTFSYKVKNAYGVWSNTATVTVTVTCSGEDLAMAICK